MNATLSRATATMIDIFEPQANPLGTTQIAQMYETMPMEALTPVITTEELPIPDEEALHTSFEAAITRRLSEQYGQWTRLSNPELPVPTPTGATRRSHHANAAPSTTHEWAALPQQQSTRRAQYAVIVACIAFTLLMFGFDCMGLLVMHLHLH